MAVLFSLAAPLHAAVIVSLEDTFPTDGSIVSQFTGPDAGSLAWRRIPGDSTIPRVTVALHQQTAARIDSFGFLVSASNGGGEMTLTIRESATALTSRTTGTVVLTEDITINVAAFSNTVENPMTKALHFDLGTTLELKAGYYYSIDLLWSAGEVSTKRMVFRYGTDTTGFVLGSWDSNATFRDTRDYIMYTAVPEPGALALLGIPALALVLRRRKQGGGVQA